MYKRNLLVKNKMKYFKIKLKNKNTKKQHLTMQLGCNRPADSPRWPTLTSPEEQRTSTRAASFACRTAGPWLPYVWQKISSSVSPL